MAVVAFAKHALSRRGIQVRRGAGLIGFLRSRRIDLVVDVGANEGQFGSELRALGYRGRIVSFEPVATAFAALTRCAAQDRDWDVRPLALGDAPARARINVSRSTVFSSFLPQREMAVAFDARAAVSGTEEVEVARLDDACPESEGRRTFLKIDTQGFERSVLAGAPETLGRALGVQLELPIEHLYADTWQIEETIGFMRRAGYVPAQIAPVSERRDDPACALELDFIFRRIA